MAVSTVFLSWALPPSHFLHLPKTSSRSSAPPRTIGSDNDDVSVKSVLYPALSHSNILQFKSAYNVQIVVGEDESEERIVNRFRKEVLKAGVIQECRRRRFFENKHDKIKRKARQASRRNRKWKPQSRAWPQHKHDSDQNKKDQHHDNDDADNWELPDVDIPYT